MGREPSADNLLDFLRGPFSRTSIEELRQRYTELSDFDRVIIALPTHPTIQTSILTPLHNAKAAFVLGHFGTCVALAGVLGEVLSIFRFEIAPDDSKRLVGLTDSDFADLGQQARIEVLHRLSLIDPRAQSLLSGIRGRRRRYMHRLRSDDRQARGDAKCVYRGAVELTRLIFGVGIAGDAITFHPDVLRMLRSDL